jgi:hypothetical protein
MKLYQYAVYTDKDILVEPTTVLAQNENQVRVLAGQKLVGFKLDWEKLNVVVRPF